MVVSVLWLSSSESYTELYASLEPDDMESFVKLLAEFPTVLAKSSLPHDVAKKPTLWTEIGKLTGLESGKVKKKIKNFREKKRRSSVTMMEEMI